MPSRQRYHLQVLSGSNSKIRQPHDNAQRRTIKSFVMSSTANNNLNWPLFGKHELFHFYFRFFPIRVKTSLCGKAHSNGTHWNCCWTHRPQRICIPKWKLNWNLIMTCVMCTKKYEQLATILISHFYFAFYLFDHKIVVHNLLRWVAIIIIQLHATCDRCTSCDCNSLALFLPCTMYGRTENYCWSWSRAYDGFILYLSCGHHQIKITHVHITWHEKNGCVHAVWTNWTVVLFFVSGMEAMYITFKWHHMYCTNH